VQLGYITVKLELQSSYSYSTVKVQYREGDVRNAVKQHGHHARIGNAVCSRLSEAPTTFLARARIYIRRHLIPPFFVPFRGQSFDLKHTNTQRTYAQT